MPGTDTYSYQSIHNHQVPSHQIEGHTFHRSYQVSQSADVINVAQATTSCGTEEHVQVNSRHNLGTLSARDAKVVTQLSSSDRGGPD